MLLTYDHVYREREGGKGRGGREWRGGEEGRERLKKREKERKIEKESRCVAPATAVSISRMGEEVRAASHAALSVVCSNASAAIANTWMHHVTRIDMSHVQHV